MGRKTIVWTFQVTNEISHKKTRTWRRKRNLMRKTESLVTTAQNNAIRTNYVEAKIDKIQQKSVCSLYCDRDKMNNHIISECSKVAQKEYKTKNDWVGKVIHRELCKKLKIDHTKKWYMPNPEYILENRIHKVLWDFEVQTDHLISARWPDLVIVNKRKRTCQIVDFTTLADHRMKIKESKKKGKTLQEN